MSAAAPGWTRGRAALQALAGRPAPGPGPAEAVPLPDTPDLWALCLHEHEAGRARLAPADRDRAQRARLETSARNLAIGAAADRARERLAAAGIPTLPIKGLDLLELYPSPGLRPMEDGDLLVPPGQLAEARVRLAELGYADDPAGRPGPFAAALRGPAGVGLDLHAALFNRAIPLWAALTREDPAAWWEHAPGGRLDPEARFLVVAAHAAKHWFVRDRWLADLALTWASGPDPRSLVSLARRQGFVPLLRLALAVVDSVLGLEVPARLRAGLGPPTGEERHLVAALARGEHDYRDRRLARFLPMVEGWGPRLRALGETLVPGPAAARERFGAPCYPAFLLGRARKALGLCRDAGSEDP